MTDVEEFFKMAEAQWLKDYYCVDCGAKGKVTTKDSMGVCAVCGSRALARKSKHVNLMCDDCKVVIAKAHSVAYYSEAAWAKIEKHKKLHGKKGFMFRAEAV